LENLQKISVVQVPLSFSKMYHRHRDHLLASRQTYKNVSLSTHNTYTQAWRSLIHITLLSADFPLCFLHPWILNTLATPTSHLSRWNLTYNIWYCPPMPCKPAFVDLVIGLEVCTLRIFEIKTIVFFLIILQEPTVKPI
jgi:hypothetical protein